MYFSAIQNNMNKVNFFFAVVLASMVAVGILSTGCGSSNAPQSVQSKNGPDSVLTALNQRILDDPENYINYVDRARYLGQISQFADAFKDIQRAMELDSNKAVVHYEKGELFWKQQDVQHAFLCYKKSIEKEPQYVDGLIKTASIEILLNNFDVAMDHLDNVLKVQMTNPQAYYFKARLFKAKKDTVNAISSYQTAVEVDPEFYDAYIELALLMAAQGNDLAEEYYKTAIQLRPRSIEVWYNRAMFLQENGARKNEYYNLALNCYDTIAKIDGNFSTAFYNKGFVYCTYLKEYTKGVDNFTQAIKLFPSYFQAYYSRGVCYEKMGNKKLALADYEMALKIKPDYDEAAIGKGRILGN